LQHKLLHSGKLGKIFWFGEIFNLSQFDSLGKECQIKF